MALSNGANIGRYLTIGAGFISAVSSFFVFVVLVMAPPVQLILTPPPSLRDKTNYLRENYLSLLKWLAFAGLHPAYYWAFILVPCIHARCCVYRPPLWHLSNNECRTSPCGIHLRGAGSPYALFSNVFFGMCPAMTLKPASKAEISWHPLIIT